MTPDNSDLWFLPLGGSGEIGMNFNLYGHDGKWLIVDCGVTFSDAPDAPVKPVNNGSTDASSRPAKISREIQMANPEFISSQRDSIVGMIITHAHEDHIGAVPWLWPRLECPVYTTGFTAEILRRKLTEFRLDGTVPVRIVESGDCIDIGPFSVEWVNMTHSTPEPHALIIKTSAASVFHTGDWKLDYTPVVGPAFNQHRCAAMADEQIDAMVCDSTNATVEKSAVSEAALYPGLKKIVAEAEGRVVVTFFGSNLARVATLARIAEETDRHLGLLGRSMINMVSAGRDTGMLDLQSAVVDAHHLGYLPRENVLLLATGSQGEPRTALNRLSTSSFRDMDLDAGDTVIFSARVIPGNEQDIEALIARLRRRKIHVVVEEESDLPIHTSGHPSAADLETLYNWVKPDLVIPVHGEPEHMQANAKIAARAGVPTQISGKNGDLYILAPAKAIKRQFVEPGRLALQGNKLVAI